MTTATLDRKNATKVDPRDEEIARLKVRVAGLEAQVTQLLEQRGVSPTWWKDQAGKFENDPVFAEIVRLGRATRDRSLGDKRKRAAARH